MYKCPKCNSKRFVKYEIVRQAILIDKRDNFIEVIDETSLRMADEPVVCANCNAEAIIDGQNSSTSK
jgi:DNA-directed RNA polymerase subunit RPC12/RpoP